MISDAARREGPSFAGVLRLGLLLVVWLGFIVLSSGEFGAELNTDAHLWQWFASRFPGLLGSETWAAIAEALSWLVRKAAHIVEYAVLGLVAAWSLRRWMVFGPGSRAEQRMTITVLLFGALVSLGDELSQSTIALRTGSLADALLDVLGLGLGLWCASCVARRMYKTGPGC